MSDSTQHRDIADSEGLPDEASRFRLQQELENRKLKIEERKLEQARSESRARIWSTILISGLATVLLTIYAKWSDSRAQQRAAIAEQARVSVELVNAREKASTELRAKMFEALLQNYFKEAHEREQITILTMIALNFRDAVQIRPMLELLNFRILQNSNESERAQLQNELRRAARLVIKDQLEQIRLSKDGAVSFETISAGGAVPIKCPPNTSLKLVGIKDEFTITLQATQQDGSPPDKPFDVTFLDMPMVDYKTVRSKLGVASWRFALVLQDVSADKKTADIAIACLPVSQVGAERRYAFDELLEKYLFPTDVQPSASER